MESDAPDCQLYFFDEMRMWLMFGGWEKLQPCVVVGAALFNIEGRTKKVKRSSS